jgi:hypothetical protein
MYCKVCEKKLDKRAKTGCCRVCFNKSRTNKPSPLLGKKISSCIITCKQCTKTFETYLCRKDIRKYCSKKCVSNSRVAVRLPKERVKKSAIGHSGERSHWWKGGVTEKNKLIRGSFEYKWWREEVFKRDDYTCSFCQKKGVFLHADHIKPFSLFPELRFDLQNGRTLCVPCHKSTDTFAGKIRKKYGAA